MGISTRRTGFIFAFVISLVATLCRGQANPDTIWLEGESPSAVVPADFKLNVTGGPQGLFSGGKWLHIAVDANKQDALLPKEGITLTYSFDSAKAGDFDVWMRVGFEKIRSPFTWRIDDGAWTDAKPTDPTIDVQELGVWAPVAWLHAGKASLTAGAHKLEIHADKVKATAGKAQNFIFALDAICITNSTFHPDGGIKPGDTSWMTDADKAAAQRQVDVPADIGTAQTAVSLKGPWQYAGDDEMEVTDRLAPTAALVDLASLNWRALEVPGDRNQQLPRDRYVHRYYLRTRINVPASQAGKSFVLHVPEVNMMATIFMNGKQCGVMKTPGAACDCDVTKAVVAGQVNELVVVVKDAFYGVNWPDEKNHLTYVPYDFWRFSTGYAMDMLVFGRYYSGLVRTAPSLVVGGAVYTADVFAKPSVQTKSLALEITLHNPTAQAAEVSVVHEIVPLAGGAAEKTFQAKTATVPAGQDAVLNVSEGWENPKLWWPDDPQQYNVITRVSIAGKVVDERKTKFGFREWTWDGPDFKLNGIPWHGFADTDTTDIAKLKSHNQTMVRVWFWQIEKDPEAYLDECDAKGMPVRRTGIFDGEGANYGLVNNEALWDNYRQTEAAFIKSQRNHPSIFIWSLENEIVFINGHVFGHDDLTTAEMKKSYEIFKQVDPTRPEMDDGGNALLDESMPVYGGHYMEPPFNTMPESCYDRDGFAHRQHWPITQVKPLLFGEAAYLNGNTPSELATVGGEEASIGPAESRPARATILRMLSEGYRWNGVNFHFWVTNEMPYYKAWSPTVVLCRQWDWTFGSEQKVTRKLGIFNDTRSTDPITLTTVLSLDGKEVSRDSSVHNVAPGMNEKFDVVVSMPKTAARQDGTWKLTLTRGGQTVFEDEKAVSVLPVIAADAAAPANAAAVAVFDPNGGVEAFLAKAGIAVTHVADLAHLPDAKVLIVGKDALDAATSTSSLLASWAAGGRTVIVLEQKNQLKYQGLPGEMATDTNAGCLGFIEDATHPVFDGLQQKDFGTWGQDGQLYRNAYVKPVSGGKSLVQCDNFLRDSALVQMQAGKGILLLSQLLIGEKLADNAAAQHLLVNMVKYGRQYQLVFHDTHVVAAESPELLKALDQTGLQYDKASDVLAAIATPGTNAVIDATPANLAALAAHADAVKAFTEGGGWIIFNRLTPEGLADYNRLVGVDHLIRKFRKEKVTWSAPRNPITAGLPTANIVLGTGKKIMDFAPPEWPDENGYSYVVDLDDAAPFGTSTYSMWNNAVNGFTQKDGAWQLIENLPPEAAVIPIKLARPEKLLSFTWVSDTNYQGTTKIELEINGKKYPFDTLPNGDPQTFDLPDQPTADALTVRVVDWTHDPAKANNVGIDNIYIKVERSADFRAKVKPILNIGAMVAYPQGKGGIVLCNIKFQASEQNPQNAVKKRTVIASLLRNMQARFAGGSSIIAGSNIDYTPISIADKANQFRGEQGWFGDKTHTFDALPPGKQTMAGVVYDVYHFTTSVVPEAIMLGGRGVPGKLPDVVKGIPVHQKADALFFLQTAHLTTHMNDRDRKEGKKFEMADYVIHYADGTMEKAPIYAEISVDDYIQESPRPVPDAQIAWQRPYESGKGSAVAYSMQWNNPHPEKEIAEIDLTYGPDKRGIPALLAITAGKTHQAN